MTFCVLSQLAMLRPEALTFITVQDILNGDIQLMTALVARLFCTHSTLVLKSRQVAQVARDVENVEHE